MVYEPLTPLPFLPIPGAFNLNTFIPGSSDYEIMARLIQTYNKAVELFNQIISQYSDIDATITELTKEYQKQLDAYKKDTDNHISSFENDISTTVNEQNSKITALAQTVVLLQGDINDLLNGKYIDNYVKALATWIDNNLQQLVGKVVKYVWFEVDEEGYFAAYIPDTWDFVNFGTELDPDKEDYGKLVLDWEPLVPDDPAAQAIPIIPEPEPEPETIKLYVPDQSSANIMWTGSQTTSHTFTIFHGIGDDPALKSFTINTSIAPVSLDKVVMHIDFASDANQNNTKSIETIVETNDALHQEISTSIDMSHLEALAGFESLAISLRLADESTSTTVPFRKPSASSATDDAMTVDNYQGTIEYTLEK